MQIFQVDSSLGKQQIFLHNRNLSFKLQGFSINEEDNKVTAISLHATTAKYSPLEIHQF
jgi:hypothetical protein